MKAWNVFRHGVWINTVEFLESCNAACVLEALKTERGYPKDIVISRAISL